MTIDVFSSYIYNATGKGSPTHVIGHGRAAQLERHGAVRGRVLPAPQRSLWRGLLFEVVVLVHADRVRPAANLRGISGACKSAQVFVELVRLVGGTAAKALSGVRREQDKRWTGRETSVGVSG